jgi:hypothetical protein
MRIETRTGHATISLYLKIIIKNFAGFFMCIEILIRRTYSVGRSLGRNPNNSLKSFPPCYSQSPPQHCLEIYISSNSRNLVQFL